MRQLLVGKQELALGFESVRGGLPRKIELLVLKHFWSEHGPSSPMAHVGFHSS